MQIQRIIILFAITVIVKGQQAAAQGLYQPIILSLGAALALFSDKKDDDDDGFNWKEYINDKLK